ncbi:MAG: phosphotransferase [Lachnoclostridium sp.]|nr:phosphotransferase [Lachnoclostridium sp.]
MTDKEILTDLYVKLTGTSPESITNIKGSGSSRRYYRIEGPRQVIGTVGDNLKENDAFCEISYAMRLCDMNAPEVLVRSDDGMAYLQTDCGKKSLFDCLDRMDLLERTMKQLVEAQYVAGRMVDHRKCYPAQTFDAKSIMWDLNYFKYCFLKFTGIDFDEAALEEDFDKMASRLKYNDRDRIFMLRDFQSRNVLIDDDENITFIDFQGGRRGPALYDVASFLWQARAGFTPEQRHHLIDVYLDAVSQYVDIDRDEAINQLNEYVLLRRLQTLGAYGFRGLFERKSHFINSIEPALDSLRDSLYLYADTYPYLTSVLDRMIDAYRQKYGYTPTDKLTVIVSSFSYKNGIPEDMSGNGGGFVFDCRGIPNPGRYAEYKQLTGMDAPVIKFLEEHDDVAEFIGEAEKIVDISVKTYLERGFTSLVVNFGCTGGQHRSVYCAEQMAKHINQYFNVDVRLQHREQCVDKLLTAK